MRIKVVGTGRTVPAERVTTRALEERLGLGQGTLETVTGVIERYVCQAESQIDLACVAATLALEDAGLEP
ncbi:MAG: ketoacyl-ACP synthase III, partial [Mesorhizobium sp.]